MTKKKMPRIKDLRAMLAYDAATGALAWRVDRSNAIKAGSKAGSATRDRYMSVLVDGRRHYAHRIAWALHYGRWPKGQIDHINGDRSDNRLINLRDVTPTENARNRAASKLASPHGSGIKFHPRTGLWRASIGDGGRCVELGAFKELRTAKAARRAAEMRLGYHQNHGRKA